MDTTVRLGPLKFSLRATIDHHGPSIHSGHYTAPINCCEKTFDCNDHTITEFGIIDNKNSSSAYVILYKLIDTWFLDSNRRVGVCFKQHFDTRYLVFCNPSPPRMFLSLDFLSEYRIQHGSIGPFYVTSSFSTWIFCRGVSGFATDSPCDVWCRGLTTCLLHVGPHFGNQFLNTSWAVGWTYWIVYLHFCILTIAIIYVLIHYIIFGFIFIS